MLNIYLYEKLRELSQEEARRRWPSLRRWVALNDISEDPELRLSRQAGGRA